MSIGPTPAFVGKITVNTGVNDALSFYEGAALVGATIPANTYELEDLAVLIGVGLTANTTVGNAYTGAFDTSTGLITINRTGGATDWQPDLLSPGNIWTGGLLDSYGAPLVAGETGLNHLGFPTVAVLPGVGASFTSSTICANCWYPVQPPLSDDENKFEIATTVQATSIGGKTITYDFSGYKFRTGDSLDDRNQLRTLGWEFITESNRTSYLSNFWGPYAKAGYEFRFYEDKTNPAFLLYRFHGDSTRTSTFFTRRVGYKFFSGSFEMIRSVN